MPNDNSKQYSNTETSSCLSEENLKKAIDEIERLSGTPFKPDVIVGDGITAETNVLQSVLNGQAFPVFPENVEKYTRITGWHKIKSVLDGEWYLCGCCGHKLARRVDNAIQVFETVVPHNNPDNFNPAIEIKCKHKSKGEKCDTINVIEI